MSASAGALSDAFALAATQILTSATSAGLTLATTAHPDAEAEIC
jgi:hypothetical protein